MTTNRERIDASTAKKSMDDRVRESVTGMPFHETGMQMNFHILRGRFMRSGEDRPVEYRCNLLARIRHKLLER